MEFPVFVFGALVGAVLVGSLDVSSQGIQVGKSLVGGVIGGWVGVVIGKKILGIERSTGDNWVVPLCVGIAIGRLGCFFTGLADQTYGVATILPWGVDFGDGVLRRNERPGKEFLADKVCGKQGTGMTTRIAIREDWRSPRLFQIIPE
jgi:hypothetical protein